MINSSVISRTNEQVLAHFLVTCHQLLRGSWRRCQQVCKKVTRKLMFHEEVTRNWSQWNLTFMQTASQSSLR